MKEFIRSNFLSTDIKNLYKQLLQDRTKQLRLATKVFMSHRLGGEDSAIAP